MAKPKPVVTLRKPPASPPADPKAVEAFVRGSANTAPRPSNVQTLKRSDVQTSKAVVERADGRTLRRMTVYLPAELAGRLRVQCAEADVDVSSFIAETLADRLGLS